MMSSDPRQPPESGSWAENVASSRELPVSYISRREGLAGAQVHDIAIDGRSVLWMAGSAGLAAYDGTRVTCYGRNDGLSTQGLRSVSAGRDGQIWLGSDIGVDVVEPSGRIHADAGADEWPGGLVHDVLPLGDGTIFAATGRGLMRRDITGTWALVSTPAGINAEFRSLTVTNDGALWAASPVVGIVRAVENRWGVLEHDDWTAVGPVLVVRRSASDGRIVIGGERGAMEIDGRGRIHRRLDEGTTGRTTTVLSTEESVWAAIGGRVVELRDRGDTWAPVAVHLDNVSCNALEIDDFGNIWVATDSQGVAKISTLRAAVRRVDCAPTGSVLSLRPSRSGDVLVGGDRHSWRISDGGHVVETIDELDGFVTWDLIETTSGERYAATANGTIRIEPDGSTTPIGADHPVLVAQGRVLLERRGELLVGTLNGLVSIGPDGVREITDCTGGSLGYVYTLLEGCDGRVWIGTLGRGLLSLDSEATATQVSAPDLRSTGSTYGIAEGPSGSLFVSEDDRIVRLDPDGTSTILVETDDPVAGWSLDVSDDEIWVGSSAGLRCYDRRTGEQKREIASLLGPDGWEFTTSRSLLRLDTGYLCGTNSGLLLVHRSKLPDRRRRPQLRTATINWSNARPVVENAVHVLQEGKWVFDVRATSDWRYDEHDLRFRFRLLGFDEAWSEPSADPTARYSSLPVGEYTLTSQAWSPLVGWGPQAVLLSLRVDPDTTFLTRVLVGIRGERRRANRLAATNLELEQSVRERTIALEESAVKLEELNAQLTTLATSDPLTRLFNRRYFDDSLQASWTAAAQAQEQLGLLMIDVDYFKSYNDLLGHQAGDQCIIDVARVITSVGDSRTSIAARYGGEEFALILTRTDRTSIELLATSLCGAVRAAAIPHPNGHNGIVTVSIGGAVADPGTTAGAGSSAHDLIRAADDALYTAKRSGRDRSVIAP